MERDIRTAARSPTPSPPTPTPTPPRPGPRRPGVCTHPITTSHNSLPAIPATDVTEDLFVRQSVTRRTFIKTRFSEDNFLSTFNVNSGTNNVGLILG